MTLKSKLVMERQDYIFTPKDLLIEQLRLGLASSITISLNQN